MKKLMALTALVILSGAFAKAEDKGTEFKFGGELRERYVYDNNPTFLNSNGDVESHFLQRTQFHVNTISSDRIQAYFNVLNFNIWGATGAVPMVGSGGAPYTAGSAGVPNAAANTSNMNALLMHEAWLWWKASDMLSFKAGRMTAEYGDGLVVAKNDWYAVPLNFDGLMGRLSWDFLDLDFGGVKLGDIGVPAPTTPTTTGTVNTDTEFNVYALYASLKNLPDVLKTVDVGIIQAQGDTFIGTVGATNMGLFAPGLANGGAFGLTTIALHLKGEAAIIDYRVDAAFQSGKQKATTAGAQDVTFGGSMYDIEVGANFPEFMKGRLFVDFHVDTGNDKSTTAPGGGDASKNNAYQPLFYDSHKYGGGFMDFFGWGNFTNINVGFSVKPDENVMYGLEFNIASRTTNNVAYSPKPTAQHNMFIAPTTSNFNDSALGTELDLFAKHTYGHGLSSVIDLSYLTLGNYFKNTGTPATALTIGSAWQAVAQLQYNF